MDFSLNEEQEMFRNYVRKCLNEAGQTMVAREFTSGNTSGFLKLQRKLAELGCTGITISEEYGGLGLGALDLVPVLEEFGRAVLPGSYLETMAFVVPLLEKYGTREQKETYLPEIAAGERSFSVAWVEPNKSYDPDVIACQAEVKGNSLVINGVKTLVPDGNHVDSLLLIVRTADKSVNGDGLSLVLIDVSEVTNLKTLSSLDETRNVTEITFENVEVPMTHVLGEVNQGCSALKEGLLYLHAATSSVLVGSMDHIVEMSTEYAKIREQFGQPIGRFQAIKHRIVDMKLDLETARSLSHYANWALDTNQQDKEAAIYSARAFATEANIRLASHNIQNHGGIGFTMEMDCHLFLKRARFYENYMGSISQFREDVSKGLRWSDEKPSFQLTSK
ncbi:acyl-CoA dehydrogenase family protein [Oceanobacillus bengalensis]|uniref:Acyl-CoA dehydrogenase n=1 Tax=Oceanobacillus bengalensis TaxID=1435466 RepID=A0A494YT47_9BACI|nr:acyl-CoA dehydrogenase family protein [Oceanobacillus bengalensis]RKQ13305.1 acyl-CoA dehydrogenase [Oceanobacillus bengalensis]